MVHARWVVPVVPRGVVLEHHSMAVRDGRIVGLGPTGEMSGRFRALREQDLKDNRVLVPGLVNGHTHTAMTLLRGFVDNVELMEWLQTYIWPTEGTHVDPGFIQDGTELAIAEMLRAGVTCFIDMYFFPGVTADVVDRMGVRAGLGVPVIQSPTPWSANEAECFAKGRAELIERFLHHPRIQPMVAPHAPYSVSDDGFKGSLALAHEFNLRLHTHLHETKFEVESPAERPIARLSKMGILTPKTVLAHMVHVNPEEISQMAQLGVHVVHCPSSNLKLASGLAPVADLLAAGVNVCLGTDGAASNDDLNVGSEMKCASFVSKLRAQSPVALPAWTLLEMATINGAKALGWESRIGSLEVGKEADFVAIHLRNAPIFDVASTLVYVGTNVVTDVWVAGKQLLDGGKLVGIDESLLTKKGNAWAEKIAVPTKK